MLNRRNFLGSTARFGAAAALATSFGSAAFAANETDDAMMKKDESTAMMAKHEGTFSGLSNHVTSGSVRIVEEEGRTFVDLGEDFSLDGGPDPRVYFGANGAKSQDGYLGALVALTGKQRYAVPPTLSLADFTEVYIWCDVADVPLGVASIK